MSLTDTEKQLITDSFAKVEPIADTAAELFYGRLFEIAPDTKPLFKDSDMAEQGKKLMQTLGVAVGALNDLGSVVPAIEALGKRHVGYGVTAEQYDTVGEALIWTLEQGLGDAFTEDVKSAWVKVYGVLADVAKSAYEGE